MIKVELALLRIKQFARKTVDHVAVEVYEILTKYGEGYVNLERRTPVEGPKSIIDNPERYYCLVALPGEEIIGVGAYLRRDLELLRIVVRPEYRGRGFGKLLVMLLTSLAFVIDRPYEVRMFVRKDNERMLNLAKKMGYKVTGEKENSYKLTVTRPDFIKAVLNDGKSFLPNLKNINVSNTTSERDTTWRECMYWTWYSTNS